MNTFKSNRFLINFFKTYGWNLKYSFVLHSFICIKFLVEFFKFHNLILSITYKSRVSFYRKILFVNSEYKINFFNPVFMDFSTNVVQIGNYE